jgi:hypothetical protein
VLKVEKAKKNKKKLNENKKKLKMNLKLECVDYESFNDLLIAFERVSCVATMLREAASSAYIQLPFKDRSIKSKKIKK